MKSLRMLTSLLRDSGGLAVTEFAFAAPIFVVAGFSGLETANYGLSVLRVNQVASATADVLSRSGELDGLGMKHIRESDINDAFTAVARQSGNLDLVARGRVIVSSIEKNSLGGQYIHWQRCYGSRTSYTSSYGTQGAGATNTTYATGFGPTNAKAAAPDTASAVMYVEVKYQYKPILNIKYANSAAPDIIAHAAFLVRDRRDLSNTNNPVSDVPTAQKKTC